VWHPNTQKHHSGSLLDLLTVLHVRDDLAIKVLFCFPDFSGEAGVMLLFSLAPQHQPELTIQKTMAALQQKNNLSSKSNLASAQVNSLSACLLILLRSKGTDVATDCATGNCGNKRKDCAKHDEAYRQRSRCRSFSLSLSLSGALLIPFTL